MSKLTIQQIPNNYWEQFSKMASSEDAYLSAVYEDDNILNRGWTENSHNNGNLGFFIDTELVGYSQYGVNSQNVAWFSLYIDVPYRRRGYAKEAVYLLNQYLFEIIKVTAIRHTAFISNSNMVKVLKSVGAIEVGIIRMGGVSVVKSTGEKRIKPCIILEYNIKDYSIRKNNEAPSPQKSYGINNTKFRESEKLRLRTQAALDSTIKANLDKILKSDNNPITVVDVGCGVGNMVYQLAEIYPTHSFIGLDIEKEFISEANMKLIEHPVNNLSYKVSDISTEKDVIKTSQVYIFRLVAQHMGLNGIKNAIANILQLRDKRPTHFIITDVDDRGWIFEPHSSAINFAINCAQNAQAQHGGDRFIGAKLPLMAQELGLQIESFSINPFDSIKLGIDKFDEITRPLLYQKLDYGLSNNTAKMELCEQIENWLNIKNRFGMGLLMTAFLCTK